MSHYRLVRTPETLDAPDAPESFDFVNGREAWEAGWYAGKAAATPSPTPPEGLHDDWCDGSGSSAGGACCRLAASPAPDPGAGLREDIASAGFTGHKPLPNGKCEHRWRNRQTKAVTCRFADGWHAGQVAHFVAHQGLRADVLAVILDMARDTLTSRDEVVAAGWVVVELPLEAEVRSLLAPSAEPPETT